LLDLAPDFIVLDEVQMIKQRDKHASQRREALLALLSAVAERNPDVSVLGMSATPVINTLKEAKMLLEAIKGCSFPDLREQATINNALLMHRSLHLHGFRYRPRYEQEMQRILVPITRNEVLEGLLRARINPLALEQVLFPAKLDASRPYIRRGTIIYAHYVDQIVPELRQEIEQMGFSVGLYTGEEKSGFHRFCQGKVDVLIGTRPLGTGVDGLQKVCNRLVMLVLPWTGAEYEQIVGRIRRQGSTFTNVEIILPRSS
jgi:superfamily II DNA or RNA helicase